MPSPKHDGYSPGWGIADEMCSPEDVLLNWWWAHYREEMLMYKRHIDKPETCPCSKHANRQT